MRKVSHMASALGLVVAVFAASALGLCMLQEPIPKKYFRFGYARSDGAIHLWIYQCDDEPVTARISLMPEGVDGAVDDEPLVEARSLAAQPGAIILTLGRGHAEDDFVTTPGSVAAPREDFVVEVDGRSDDHDAGYSVSQDDIPQVPAVGRRTSGSDLSIADFEDEAKEAC